MRVEITDIHPYDSFYDEREQLIGLQGEFELIPEGGNWYKGIFSFDEEINLPLHGTKASIRFQGIKVRPPSAKRDFSGPAIRVKCINNEGVGDIISMGKNYEVVLDSATLYHIKTNKGYTFFFPKEKFIRIA
jgi:hypothetical protein